MTGTVRGHDARVVSGTFQVRFLGTLAVILALAGVLLFLALYLVLARPLPGDYSAVFLTLRHLPPFLLPVIAISGFVYALLACLATAVLCILALHKVAGPLYRMERILEGYLDGASIRPAFFRDGDQVAMLATAFNKSVGRLREDRQAWLGLMEHAERLCFQDRATCRLEMEKALAELEIHLAKYR